MISIDGDFLDCLLLGVIKGLERGRFMGNIFSAKFVSYER